MAVWRNGIASDYDMTRMSFPLKLHQEIAGSTPVSVITSRRYFPFDKTADVFNMPCAIEFAYILSPYIVSVFVGLNGCSMRADSIRIEYHILATAYQGRVAKWHRV
jgi:hypothetical protein